MSELKYLTSKEVKVLEKGEICRLLKVDDQLGLSLSEVQRRLEHFGSNEIPDVPATPWWKIVLTSFEDRMVQILLGAALISFIMAISSGEFHDLVEPFVIVVILALNAIVGFWQESSAEAAIKELKSLAPSIATVIRDGQSKNIPCREVVIGDVIEVSVGQRVPADARIVKLLSTTVRVDQSLLTGESVEIIKHANVESDSVRFARNMLFSGTNITYGRVRCIVVAIGTRTEMGIIDGAVRSVEEEKTPLQHKLDEFGELLSKVIGVICVLVFIVNIFRFVLLAEVSHGYVVPVIHSLKLAISLAVAAIPEGLPAVVTTCLALGARRMARRNALVRSLPSVETLGCCNVICSDKTGTLTTNMMSVSTVYTMGSNKLPIEYSIKESQLEIIDSAVTCNKQVVICPLEVDKSLEKLACICSICNDANLEIDPKSDRVRRVGDATEAALLVLSEKLGFSASARNSMSKESYISAYREALNKAYKKNATLEFTRERKSMSVHCTKNKENYLLVKGAPESVLQRCSHALLADGVTVPLDGKMKLVINEKLSQMSSQALRCIAVSYKIVPSLDMLNLDDPSKFHEIEDKLIFCGLIGMLDPPRLEVKQAISDCYRAGIRVVVITGDSKETAESICGKIGIIQPGDDLKSKSFTGPEFYDLPHHEQVLACKSAVLFSRVDPSLKSLLVSILQDQKLICAMTGDGVNDAPALKRADIGIAMGTGTEVAKAASKMVLADDNFSTIVVAIAEGRAIYNNTKQFIRYLISSNIGEVVCIFTTGLLGLPDALEPVQLLWVNLVTDGLPATALGFNPPDPDIMENPPRNSKEPIVNGWLFARYLIVGVYVGLATIGGFIWWFIANGYSFQEIMNPLHCNDESYRCSALREPREARAVALSVLVVVEMFNALNAISENESIFKFPPYKNPWLLVAIASSMSLHFMIMYVPVFCYIFSLAPLGVVGIDPRNLENISNWYLIPTDFTEWKAIIALSFPVIIIDEILKYVTRYLQRKVRKSE